MDTFDIIKAMKRYTNEILEDNGEWLLIKIKEVPQVYIKWG